MTGLKEVDVAEPSLPHKHRVPSRLDEALRDHSRCAKPARVECVNRFDQLDQAGSSCSDKHMDSVDVNVDVNFKQQD